MAREALATLKGRAGPLGPRQLFRLPYSSRTVLLANAELPEEGRHRAPVGEAGL